MTQDHHHRPMGSAFEGAIPEPTGIGELLKTEREKRGLSYCQISQRTRLRRFVLEALEKEDWNRLPQPVFVRGFLRSYATVLGMNPERVLSLYPAQSTPSISSPSPVGEPLIKKTKPIFIAVGLACVAIWGYGLYKHGGAHMGALLHPEGIPSSDQSFGSVQVASKTAPSLRSSPNDQEGPMPGSAPENPARHGTSPPAAHSSSPEGITYTGRDTEPSPFIHPPSPSVDLSLLPVSSPLILRASVTERTWVRIAVDDQAPKEYIFSAGSHPRWKAQDHFHLLIGNAGGMKLKLNGTNVGDMGDSGEVIRLRLP